jgi:hypothetical protein
VCDWKLLEFAKANIPATKTKQPSSEHGTREEIMCALIDVLHEYCVVPK